MSGTRALVLGVDGGNSKTDVALVGAGGRLLAALRGPTVSHQAVGIEAGMERLAELVERVAREAGISAGAGSARDAGTARDGPLADVGVFSLAGADFPRDERILERGIERLGLARRAIVRNDTFGALRAGTDRPWGVVLVCGQGINAAGVGPNGRVVRFPGVGDISGDWGGGQGLGMAALAAAVRGRDGRGPRTSLERLVPAHFGLSRPYALVQALYAGRVRQSRISELAPLVFQAAAEGDAVARGIVDRLADELMNWARAVIRRLVLTRLDPDVVLAGGVFRTEEQGFYDRLAEGIHAVAPRARLVRLTAPPVLGAVLLGLDSLAASDATAPEVADRLRAAFTRWRSGGAADR